MYARGGVCEVEKRNENVPSKPKQMVAEREKRARGDDEDQSRGGGGGRSGCG